jgi:ribosomal protein S18 acetylase RimI-like enzyme
MAITAADMPVPFLPLVRRLEAAGFRAWPAETVVYDGSWLLRMTPGHPSRRLNSLVPLDPHDARDMDIRIDNAIATFRARGIRPTVKQSPLCPPGLPDVLKDKGFSEADRTLVLVLDLDKVEFGTSIDHLPIHDVERFAEACARIDDGRDADAATIASIIGRIQPTAGLFLMEGESGPSAVGICVQDNDLAGLQQIVVSKEMRRRGLGREIVCSSLRWARVRNARQAWLQVLANNDAALALYETMGFKPAYTYSYWRLEA